MKKEIRLSLVLLAAMAVVIGSCKKDFDDDLSGANAGNSVSDIKTNQPAEERSICGAIMYKDSAGKARMDEMEQTVQSYIARTAAMRTGSSASTTAIVTIPVVFHVLYNIAEQNISDAQLQSQIDALNNDFTASNTDLSSVPACFQSAIGNPGFQFVLAKRDPAGNATNGIIRKQTSVASFSSDGAVCSAATGGDDAWPATQYLNIWVCNKTGAAGFAAYPWSNSPSTDGVIIGYNYVGTTGTFTNNWSYQLGRTVAHEVGHWFGLPHIWGDSPCGDDLVSDTPPQSAANGSCPTFPHMSSCSPNSGGDMFMNYMDYSNDACRTMFSAGQAIRMISYLNTTRAGLLTSLGGVAPNSGATCDTPGGLKTNSITETGATLGWTSTGATSYNVRYKSTASSTWIAASSASSSTSVSGLSASTTYEFQVQSDCSGDTSSYSSSFNFTTSATTPPCVTPTSLSVASIKTNGATLNWFSTGGSGYNVMYKTTAGSSWTTASSSTNSLVLSGLSSYTAYEFKVQSVCTGDSSSYSSPDNFTTLAPACALPTSLSASSITANGSTLNWTATGGSGYNVMYKATTASSWTTTSASTNSLVLSGLSPSTTYSFKVQNICSANTSSYTSSVNFTTSAPPCAIPSSLSASSITASGATLNWSATGGSGYNVKYKSTTASSWTTVSVSTNSLVLSGLSASTNYEFQVQSDCSGNTSSYSSSFNFTTLASAPTCTTPTSLSVASIKTNGATLKWSATGGSGYKVMYKSTSASSWTTVSASTNSLTISGLSASTSYQFKVQTVCTSGSSSYSSTSTFTTLKKKGGKNVSVN